MGQFLANLVTSLVVLALVGCGAGSTDEGDGTAGTDAGGSEEAEATDDGTDATATTDGGDETEDTASGSGGLSCEDFQNGEPCGPEAEALDCSATIMWCEQEVVTAFCECSAGTWSCLSAGPPGDCHECCTEALGEMYYCVGGDCVEASGCEAPDCCVPGEPGTAYCKATFGSCSMCQIIDDDGLCSPADCD